MVEEPENEYAKSQAARAQASRLFNLLWIFCEWGDADLSDRDFTMAVFERCQRHWAEHIGDPSR